MSHIKRFINDEQGLETVEYAIILGLIVAGTITLIVAIGGMVENAFEQASDAMEEGGMQAGD